ncbi:unnamed protein product [Callosobruchus maculatus]|uniref:TIL domain-containing protein n=1 Tax=Callosobruchus maculatus TaxID=64391 RepID=A0A653D8L8_CALMS|nr:unnamed protein product [Callosobruchus maculatus]
MKFVMFFIYGILFTMLSASLAVKCGPNQRVTPCYPCYQTCKGYKLALRCPKKCRINRTRCFCDHLWVKNSDGICIPKEDCP